MAWGPATRSRPSRHRPPTGPPPRRRRRPRRGGATPSSRATPCGGIAERELGDPFRWHDLYRRNKDRPQPDGGVLTDPDLIRPAWTLELPASTAPLGSAAGQAPAPTKPQPTLPAHQPSEQPPTTPPR